MTEPRECSRIVSAPFPIANGCLNYNSVLQASRYTLVGVAFALLGASSEISRGCDEPTFNVDYSGQVVSARNHRVTLGNLQMIEEDFVSEGASSISIPLSVKEIEPRKIF
jgi:hypothetical protein